MTTTSTTVTRFHYDGRSPNADPNGSNGLLMRRVYPDGVDQPAARIDASGNAAWYEADRQGSVRDGVNYGGTMVLDHVDYDGYGSGGNPWKPLSRLERWRGS